MACLQDEPLSVQFEAGQAIESRLGISRLAIEYPWAIVATWAVLSIAGAIAFSQLKYALFPDITFPVVIVSAQTTNIDPGVNLRSVTAPVERAVQTIPGITRVHSLSFPDFVTIDMTFDVGTDLATRKQQVEDAINTVTLPEKTTLSVTPVNLNETAVVTYAVIAGGRSMAQLEATAQREILPALRAVPGVLKVDVIGGSATGNNASAYFFDRTPAVALAVVKTGTANTLDVAASVHDEIAKVQERLHDVKILRASDQATYIKEASSATTEALGISILLAVLVILPFLRDVRATLIAALTIPVSLLGTALVMRLLNFDLETITLLALALVVGVILDDAIVAVENIVRHVEAGEDPRTAALNANREIGRTLIGATLTIVAVFLPIGLMGGTLGQFFKPFGLTASAAVIFSLLAARTLSPTLAAMLLRRRGTVDPSVPVNTDASQNLHPRYRAILHWSLGHRGAILALAGVTFLAGIALIPSIPKGFIPHLDRGEFHVTFSTPLGTSLHDTVAASQSLEAAIRMNAAVSAIYTTIGARAGQTNQGLLDVHLKPDRAQSTYEVENAVRSALPALDGVRTSVDDVPFVGNDTTQPLQFAIVGNDLAELREIGRAFSHRIEHTPGFVDVTTTGLSDGTPFSGIERIGGHDAVQITSDLASGVSLGDANDRVSALARSLPSGFHLDFGGNSADVVTTFSGFAVTLALSILAIFVVLVVLFRSWLDPLVITIGLPLAVCGALFALWITRAEFGIISLMGLIFLFGIVNKNAILIVDRIKHLRALGFARQEAILEAGSQRLRPIVMTTAAMILGMLPIALGFGAGAELRAPMAVSIIGGLVTSTALSLVVVPVAYTLIDDLRMRFARS